MINRIYKAVNEYFFDCIKEDNSIICSDANLIITVDDETVDDENIIVTIRNGNKAISEYIPVDNCVNDVDVGIAIAKSLIEMGVEF